MNTTAASRASAAVLRGRVKVDEGKRMTVVGVLRVIDHKGTVVGGVFVPPWVEMRVSEEK